jgi:hypothetical protein
MKNIYKCGTKIGMEAKIYVTIIPIMIQHVSFTLIAQVHSTVQLHSDCPSWTLMITFYRKSDGLEVFCKFLDNRGLYQFLELSVWGRNLQCFQKESCVGQPPPPTTTTT